jgi:hypothetical protein
MECCKAPVPANPLPPEYNMAYQVCLPFSDYGSNCARQRYLILCRGSKQDRRTDERLVSVNSNPDIRVHFQSHSLCPCSTHQILFEGTRNQTVQRL